MGVKNKEIILNQIEEILNDYNILKAQYGISYWRIYCTIV